MTSGLFGWSRVRRARFLLDSDTELECSARRRILFPGASVFQFNFAGTCMYSLELPPVGSPSTRGTQRGFESALHEFAYRFCLKFEVPAVPCGPILCEGDL